MEVWSNVKNMQEAIALNVGLAGGFQTDRCNFSLIYHKALK